MSPRAHRPGPSPRSPSSPAAPPHAFMASWPQAHRNPAPGALLALPGPQALGSPTPRLSVPRLPPARAHLGADRGGVQSAPRARQLSAPEQHLREDGREAETRAPTPTRRARARRPLTRAPSRRLHTGAAILG